MRRNAGDASVYQEVYSGPSSNDPGQARCTDLEPSSIGPECWNRTRFAVRIWSEAQMPDLPGLSKSSGWCIQKANAWKPEQPLPCGTGKNVDAISLNIYRDYPGRLRRIHNEQPSNGVHCIRKRAKLVSLACSSVDV